MRHTYTGLFSFKPVIGSSADGFVSHDKEVIKNSVLTILNTHKGSRVYDPEFGTNLHKLVHELNIERVRNIAKMEIRKAIEAYEPRASVSRIEAYPTGESNQEIVIMMTLEYKEFETTEIIELQLATDNDWIKNEEIVSSPIEQMFENSFRNNQK